MMKNYFIIALFSALLVSHTVRGQDADVSWGPMLKERKGGTITSIVGDDEKGYYALRSSVVASALITYSNKIFLERYNTQHELEFSKEIKLRDADKKKRSFEGLYYVDGRLIMFTSYYDKKADRNYAYAEHLNESGESEDDMVEVDEIFSDKTGNKGDFDFVVSKDKTKILVIHQEMYKKKEKEKFAYKMLTKDLSVLWEKKIELPYRDKYAVVGNYRIDSEGNVYALVASTNEKKDKAKGKANYSYHVIEYRYKEDQLKSYLVAVAGRFISEITYADDPVHNAIVCSGFYSTKSGGAIAGIFYMRIDKTSQEVTEKGMKEFGKEFLAQFLGDKKAAKGKELQSFDLRHFILREDGGAILVAEQYYEIERCRNSGGGGGVTVTRCDYHYYYNDLVCASINPDASIAWVARVPKSQHSVNDGGFYSSYLMGLSNNNLYFLFNDNPKNINLKVPKKGQPIKKRAMTSPRKSVAMLYTVEMGTGEVSFKPLFSAKADRATILKPKIYRQVTDKDVTIYGERGKNYKFGTLTFN